MLPKGTKAVLNTLLSATALQVIPEKAVSQVHLNMHTQTLVGSTWLSDNQGIPSEPTNSLFELNMVRYQVRRGGRGVSVDM